MNTSITRRALLAIAGGAVVGFTFRLTRAKPRYLRPPGALDEKHFLAACIRCFRCAEVCPVECIRFDLDDELPLIDVATRACTECMKCGDACPTDALVEITKAQVRMGAPALDQRRCLAWNERGNCHACHEVCPHEGAVTLDYATRPVFHDDACVGCGLCAESCPVDVDGATGRRAIHIEPFADGGTTTLSPAPRRT